jgi:hypothetical protein
VRQSVNLAAASRSQPHRGNLPNTPSATGQECPQWLQSYSTVRSSLRYVKSVRCDEKISHPRLGSRSQLSPHGRTEPGSPPSGTCPSCPRRWMSLQLTCSMSESRESQGLPPKIQDLDIYRAAARIIRDREAQGSITSPGSSKESSPAQGGL